ncbi:peptidoglycan DD-metalloendopeptidase family protein [Candidatus Peregrinibacteria bacterium]|nr:peptidoglycan DD-metalloendopeptidase family protein [Candidatus Peregrinibacteria bacterium]
MEVTENILQVNKFARRNRHLRIFSRRNLFKIHALDFLKFFIKPIKLLGRVPLFEKIWSFLVSTKLSILELVPAAPQKRLVFQGVLIAGTTLFVTSITPGGTLTAASMNYSHEYISSYSLPGDILVSDEEGYLIKINPQTDDSSRVGLTDYAVHTIESGESLSLIASRYSVSVETIMWENNLRNANSIRTGQKLLIPPVDGISYKVVSGDSLGKIAKKYDVSADAIIAQNGLENEELYKGQTLFLPGTKPITPVNVASADARASSTTRSRSVSYTSAPAATTSPSFGKIFIYPTRGKITQGYHAGHYAIDIADNSRPPVWASGAGTVTKASSGTWGGGYGNHVIIDHGGGLQSLYAHLDTVNVYEGQWVSQGDVLGIMGNTGRVYGVTGIHLHWEVIQDGVKQYPGNYY